MTRSLKFAGLLLASTLVTPAIHAQSADIEISAENPLVSLTVQEEVRSAPDTASFGTGVTTKAPTAREALSQNSAQMDRLISRLKALGIASKDIQTSGISLNAEYDYRQNQERFFTGYRVTNQVRVTVRDIKRLGELLDEVVQAGSNDLNGPNFYIEDDAKVKEEARKRAFERAREQARVYARMAGFSDVRLVSVSESLSGSGPIPYEKIVVTGARIARDSAAPVEPGEIGTTVTVNVQYEMTR